MVFNFTHLILGGDHGYEFAEGSQVFIKFCSNISVPGYMSFFHCAHAFEGGFKLILGTEYEIYHERREIVLREIEPTDKAQEDSFKSVKTSADHGRSLTSHPKTNNNDIQRANQETEEGQVHIGGIYDDEEAIHVKILEIIDDLSSGQQTLETDTFEEYIEEEDDDGKKFVRQKDDLPAERVLYYVYRSSASRRQKILQYAIFTTAHLGVFAFLFQVFDDRGVIMQVCCYSQLAVLLLCFLLYPFSYLLDIMAVFRIQQAAKYFEFLEREEYYLEQESGTRYIHRIYVVNEFEISPNQSTEKQKKLDGITWTTWGLVDSNSYTSPILDVLFAVTALMVECLTIVYVYNNTRQDDRKQGDDESQALSAISNACKLLGCE